jgi:hypothetical protein
VLGPLLVVELVWLEVADEGGSSTIAIGEEEGGGSLEYVGLGDWPVIFRQNGTVNHTVVPTPLVLSIPMLPPRKR